MPGLGGNRRLNHVEFAHRPGEAGLVVELFETLGCSCELIDTPPYRQYIVVSLDGSPHGDNDMFASEAEPEQRPLGRDVDPPADVAPIAARAHGDRHYGSSAIHQGACATGARSRRSPRPAVDELGLGRTDRRRRDGIVPPIATSSHTGGHAAPVEAISLLTR